MGKYIFLFSLLLILLVSSSFTSNNPKEDFSKYDPSSFDPETIDWLSRVDSAGGTVSDSIAEAVDDYIKEIKGLKYQTSSIRELLIRENWFCGDFNSSFVPVFRNSDPSDPFIGSYQDINHNYSQEEYEEHGVSSGLKGNGADRFLETGINPNQVSELSANDVHFMIFSMSDSADAGRLGCRSAGGEGLYFYPKYLNGNTYFNLNGNVESYVTTPAANGYIMVQRNSSQLLNAYYNNYLINTVQNNSTYKPNAGITIGAFNANGTITGYMSMRLGGYSIGKSMSQAQQLIHYNAVKRLMNRLGRDLQNTVASEFKSKLFTFTGNKLYINYETRPQGFLRFELQDSSGNVIPEFSMDVCQQIEGNEFSREVIWNSSGNLSDLVNIPVYLKIRMYDADLFSLQFRDQVAPVDSSAEGFIAGTYKQFFVDTLLFSNNISAIRKMHSPVKNPDPVISPEMPWEGDMLITCYSNIAYSKSLFTDQMAYKMWIRAQSSIGRVPVYYESIDGLNWTRPNLESYKFNGSTDNNIMNDNPVYPGGLYTVVDDSARSIPDPSKRYKSVYNTHQGRLFSRLNVSFSADGLVWIPYSGNPVRQIGEDLSSSGWNPVLGKYLGYFRDSLAIRKIGRYVSDDWINWTYTGTILTPDSYDIKTTGYYNMQVLFKDSVYWGFLGILRMNQNGDEDPVNPERRDNIDFIELLFSRDGINFVRCGNRQPFIDVGELGSWDDQMIYTLGVPVQFGNEYYIYYNGFNFKHMSAPPPPADGGPYKSHIGLAKIGLDRFVSLTAF